MSLTLASEARSSYLKPLLVAALVLAAVGASLFYFNPHRTGELTVTHTDLFAPETVFTAQTGGVHVLGTLGYSEKDLYVVATVRLRDELRLPLFIDDVEATYTGANGATQRTTAPMRFDLNRSEEIFPQLKPLIPQPLLFGDEVAPKSSVEGQVLLHFNALTSSDWQSRRSGILTVHFAHQEPMSVTIP